MLKFLNNRNFVLLLAFVCGLVFSNLANYTESVILPALIILLTVSMIGFSAKEFLPLSSCFRPFLLAFAFNYLVLGTLFLVLARLIVQDYNLWLGYVLIAAAPPGVAIIPFTHVLKGNVKLSLIGTFAVYLSSLAVTPIMIFLLTDGTLISPVRLVTIMFQLILIPFVVSQIINSSKRTQKVIEDWRGTIINWGFFIIVFSVVGLNRDVFLTQPQVLAQISLIAFLSTFALAFLTNRVSKKIGFPEPERSCFMLFATIKNMGFASAIALTFFNELASVPAAVTAALYAIYFIFLGHRGSQKKD
ncbi:MAG: hypothetical protein KGZ94_04090 [Clostridia bacterium]|nr:hypothetical protein [Clostridia bacterium]